MEALKNIKPTDTWSFQNFHLDEKNVLESDFEDVIFADAGRDVLSEFSSNKVKKRPQPIVTVKEIWEWLFNFPLRRRKTTLTTTTTTTTSTTEVPLQDDFIVSIGKKRRPLKYQRTCK